MTTASLPQSEVRAAELAELVERLTLRIQNRETVNLEAEILEHPEHADELRRLLPALALLADFSRSPVAGHPDCTTEEPLGVVGDFRIVREVGRGGMGVVYEAEQLSLGRRVALKVLPYAGAMDPKQIQRFKNEAKAAASLKHDHIVSVHAIGCERGVHFYAMEFVDGQTLAQFIHGLQPDDRCSAASDATQDYPVVPPDAPTKPFAVMSTTKGSRRDRAFYRWAAELIAQAAEALEHAHSLGIVHRDVKPANLLLDLAGQVYVSDFGLARLGADGGLTVSGDLLGTLRYMAPEQALARHGLVDHRADVYGLGCTLYELLTGRPAIDGTDRADILRAIAFEEPTALRRVDKSIPAELETVTLKALAKNPDERYATAGELADDLRRWMGDRAIKAKPPGVRERVAKWGRRHKYLVRSSFAVMSVAVVALAVSNLLVTREKNQKQEALETAQKRLAQIERGVDLFAEMLHGINPRAEEKGGDPLYEQLRKKAERAAAELDGEVVGDPQAVARLQSILGSTLRELGSYELSVAVLEKARATRERELGPTHTDTLTTLHHLAAAYRYVGRLPEAIRLHEQVWEAQVATLGAHHSDTLATGHNLAVTYCDAGKLPDAIRLLKQIRNDEAAKLVADHPETLSTLQSLALAFGKAGRLPEAIQLFEQVRDSYVAKLGEDHADTLFSLDNLATAYWQAGRLPEAIRLFEQVRDVRTTKLGANHPETLHTLQNLAGVYQDVGKLPDAIRLKEQVRDARMAKLGADHFETLGSVANLALAYQAAGNLNEATRLFEQVRNGFVVKLGPDHPDTLTTLSNLARVYQATRRLPEAIQLYEQARDAQVKKLGADHPSTLNTLGNLAGAYRAAGNLPEAIRIYEQVRDAQMAKLGTDHPRTLTTLNNLAGAYRAAGRPTEAIRLLEQSAEGIAKRNFLHEHAAQIIPSTIRALEEDRQFHKAEVLRRRWLVNVKEKMGPESPAYAGELASMGLLLLKLEKWADAEKTLAECLPIREKQQPDAWTTFNTMSLLGAAKVGQKNFADAEPLLLKGYEGMKSRADKIPPQAKDRLREAIDRLIDLSSVVDKPDDVAKWRKERVSLLAN